MMNYQGVGNFIVKVDKPYQDEYEAKGHSGDNLVRSHLFDDFDNANKSGIVVSAPKGSDVPVGATLYFHHIIIEWREKNAGGETYAIDKKQGLYRVPYRPMGYPDPLYNKAYAWEKDGVITTINDWILLEQETAELKTTNSGLVLVEKIDDVVYSTGEAKPKKNYARVKYLNNHFENLGLKKGDLVITKKDSEYPMNINGKTYWRVWDRFLLAKVDE